MLRTNVFFVLGLCHLLVLTAKSQRVVCYFGSWSYYRPGLGKFEPENIDPNLCTHMIYTFAALNYEGLVIVYDAYLDLPDNFGRDNYRRFNALKEKNPRLKTLLAVGGWNEGSAKYSIMAANPGLRKNFINSALSLITKYGFDGLDIDWEYPNRRDTVHGVADINNFTILLKETKEVFDKHGLLLTAAVSSVRVTASQSYDIPAISKYLDIINIMTYDMYGAWDPVTGHNSPLHKGEGDEGAIAENLYTVDQALKYWIGAGCPLDKIAMGVPFYGRTYTLRNAHDNGVRAPVTGAGIAGPYTATNGFIGYNEFCYKLQTESWTKRFDSLAKVPYAFKNRDWVSYDDAKSITAKIEYAKSLGITSVMVWSIETDDFHGICGDGPNPLLKAINAALGFIGNSPSTTESTTTVATSSNTTESFSTISPGTESPSTLPSSPSSTESFTTSAPSSTIESQTTITSTLSTTESTSTSASNPTTPTISPTSSTTESPFTPSDNVCKKEGYSSKAGDCSSFYYCSNGANGELVATEFKCPASLYWDPDMLACNYQEQVECKNN